MDKVSNNNGERRGREGGERERDTLNLIQHMEKIIISILKNARFSGKDQLLHI